MNKVSIDIGEDLHKALAALAAKYSMDIESVIRTRVFPRMGTGRSVLYPWEKSVKPFKSGTFVEYKSGVYTTLDIKNKVYRHYFEGGKHLYEKRYTLPQDGADLKSGTSVPFIPIPRQKYMSAFYNKYGVFISLINRGEEFPLVPEELARMLEEHEHGPDVSGMVLQNPDENP